MYPIILSKLSMVGRNMIFQFLRISVCDDNSTHLPNTTYIFLQQYQNKKVKIPLKC